MPSEGLNIHTINQLLDDKGITLLSGIWECTLPASTRIILCTHRHDTHYVYSAKTIISRGANVVVTNINFTYSDTYYNAQDITLIKEIPITTEPFFTWFCKRYNI